MMQPEPNFTTGSQGARLFGVHQIDLPGPAGLDNPFTRFVPVRFTAPSGHSVLVDAFYDGLTSDRQPIWRARVYPDEVGAWHWQTVAQPEDPQDTQSISGQFNVTASHLPGMLRPHPQAAQHWHRHDGQPFIHFNDTAYHLFRASEPLWCEYVRDAAALGITSLRVAALGGPAWAQPPELPEHGEGVTYPWDGDDTSRFDLSAFQTSDERLIWLLDHYPAMYLQIILFGLIEWGKDSTGEAWQAIPLADRQNTLRTMLARWAAFPQIFWLIVNDIHCTEDFPHNQAFVRQVGQWLAQHDPWQHPRSVGPRRKMAFPFHPRTDPWVSYVHIEDQYDLNASAYTQYADWGQPVFLGEDRYEQDRPQRDPLHPAFVFRCLFLSWLLAGGSASYGGRWRSLTPYFQTAQVAYATGWGGDDELVYTQGLHGLDSLPHLFNFFAQRGIQLWQFQSDNARVRDPQGPASPYPPKMARRAWQEILIYHPNAIGEDRSVQANPQQAAVLTIDLSPVSYAYLAEWFNPATGESMEGGVFLGGAAQELTAPWPGGDVILRLLATC